jgi:hypothetical protein
MPSDIRFALIGLGILFLVEGLYHRVRSTQSGERLDRLKEGWPLLIGIRLTGLVTLGSAVAWLRGQPCSHGLRCLYPSGRVGLALRGSRSAYSG